MHYLNRQLALAHRNPYVHTYNGKKPPVKLVRIKRRSTDIRTIENPDNNTDCHVRNISKTTTTRSRNFGEERLLDFWPYLYVLV